jgi:hypothetical protein
VPKQDADVLKVLIGKMAKDRDVDAFSGRASLGPSVTISKDAEIAR